VAEGLGNLESAAAAYRKSLADWETAQTWGQLGFNCIAREDKPAAIRAFQQALVLAPHEGRYWASLAYLFSETGKPEEAAVAFREAIRAKPGDISLYEGLGYAEVKVKNYSAATDAFKHVIDYYTDQPTPLDPETIEKVYGFKRTINDINQRLKVDFAEVIRLDNSPFGPEPNIVANSSYSGFGVLLADYRAVHGIGPLNSDVSVYGRFLWANKNRSLSVEKELSQAGLGVSIKPLGDYDFRISLERMFKVGSDTQNDVMVRSGASFSEGGYWHPSKGAWNYYDIYLDGAYLIESTQLYLTSNLRWGRAYKLWDAGALVPYVTGGAVDSDGNTWIDAGVGITLAIWGFESRYRAHRLLTRITLEGRQHLAGNSEDEHTVRLKYEMAF
jgi:tetratricopeptide (TPR) repeat protein